MNCPTCGGRVLVLDTACNTDTNEILRKRKCNDCECIVYTSERIVSTDESYKSTYYKHARFNNDKQKLKMLKKERENGQ